MFGPDVAASITSSELRTLVDGIRFVERMKANPLDKDVLSNELAPLRTLFTKSIVVLEDLPKGTQLKESHLALKKPGTGIPAARMREVVNRVLKRDVRANRLLSEEDLD